MNLGTKIIELKGILVTLVIVSFLIPNIYADETSSFGQKILPEKIIENTEGILQIYGLHNNVPFPKSIDSLVVTSSDSSIISIGEFLENENDFVNSVKLEAKKSGIAKIAIAAPGYESIEFPITVYGEKQHQNQLLLKTVPDKFTTSGPKKGFFTVQLADEDEFPTIANSDIEITIHSSNSALDIKNNKLIINKGEYFAIGEFIVNQPGKVLLYAESASLTPVSKEVIVEEEEEPHVELYVIPNKISNFASSYAYAIAQLQDSNGNPIRSSENISFSTTINRINAALGDDRDPDVSFASPLYIPKDSSYGIAKLSVKAGLEDSYEISISADNYHVGEAQSLETIFATGLSDPTAKLDTIPILSTGSEELVGVLYPSNDDGISIIATAPLETKIDSTDEESLQIQDIIIKTGNGPVPVFGKTGYINSDKVEISVIGKDKQTFTPKIIGPGKENLQLHAEPLISKIIAETEFPMALYMTNEESNSWYFPETINAFMPPNDLIKFTQKTITEGDSIVISNSKSNKEGEETLIFEVGDYSSTLKLDNIVPKPTSVSLSYSEPLLSGIKNSMSLQILDNNQKPIFANEDLEFNLIVDDESIELPETIIVKEGTYHTLFEIIPNKKGINDVSVLASDFPLTKTTINSIDSQPKITILSPKSVDAGDNFEVVLTAKLSDEPIITKVEWDVQGAEIKQLETTTNNEGKAKLVLSSSEPTKVSIQGKVLEFGKSESSVFSETIISEKIAEGESEASGFFAETEQNLAFLLIPAAIAGSGIVIKKKNLGESITEKIPFLEKIITPMSEILSKFEINERIDSIKEKIPIIKDR